ncbi:MAG TPA: hypothetical protein VED37_16470, partial [Ktedonobacteraceae bacterium]|nr:hypothetical protein [Ktedonobacteraceae bacterium]
STLIMLGFVLCITGAIFVSFGILCGLVMWPLLWYTNFVIKWCASIPWASIPVSNLDTRLAWSYYGVLILLSSITLRRWSIGIQRHEVNSDTLLLSPRILPVLQYAVVIIVILAAGANIAAAPVNVNEQLSITLLNVGPAGKPSQGEAILIHTIDGKTILIDGGPDATSLSQELDSRLPFWQRSIDTVILTSPRQDHLTGAQDVISRFQVGDVLDAGMLHPSTGYALWKHTIIDRNLPYSQVREGSSIQMGAQASVQVLWPPEALHKGTNEELDNALIMRLVAPHFSMLLLGSAALSKYALSGLLTSIDPGYLTANIVQVVGDAGKAFPTELSSILQEASPSLLLITPAALSSKRGTAGATTSTILPPQAVTGTWQVIQTAQVGNTTINSSANGWNVTTD